MQEVFKDPHASDFISDDPQVSKQVYILVTQRDPEAFSAAVSKMIVEQQYKPLGGVFVAMASNTPVFCQSLILAKFA